MSEHSIHRPWTEDGLQLYGVRVSPSRARGIIIHVHGLSGNHYENQLIDQLSGDFPEQGWAFAAVTTRGRDSISRFPTRDGDTMTIGSSYERFEESVFDIAAWVQHFASYGYPEIVLQGHSLGASKVVYSVYADADVCDAVGRLILLAPVNMVGYYHRSNEYAELYHEAQILIGEGEPDALLSKSINQGTHYSAAALLDMSDPAGAINIFNHHEQIPSLALSSVEVPTLAVFGDEDLEVTAGSATQELEWLAAANLHIGTSLVRGADHQFAGHLEEVAVMLCAWLER